MAKRLKPGFNDGHAMFSVCPSITKVRGLVSDCHSDSRPQAQHLYPRRSAATARVTLLTEQAVVVSPHPAPHTGPREQPGLTSPASTECFRPLLPPLLLCNMTTNLSAKRLNIGDLTPLTNTLVLIKISFKFPAKLSRKLRAPTGLLPSPLHRPRPAPDWTNPLSIFSH